MKNEGRAERLTIFVEETDQHGHQPLYAELVQRARAGGVAGATVLRGIEGFGASSRVHEAHALELSDDVPLVVVIVDVPERIDSFLVDTHDLLTATLVLREPVDVITYRPGAG